MTNVKKGAVIQTSMPSECKWNHQDTKSVVSKLTIREDHQQTVAQLSFTFASSQW